MKLKWYLVTLTLIVVALMAAMYSPSLYADAPANTHVTFLFEGTVTNVFPAGPCYDPSLVSIEVGDPYVVRLSYGPGLEDLHPEDPTFGSYRTGISYEAVIGDWALCDIGNAYLTVWDECPGIPDGMEAGNVGDPPDEDWSVSWVSVRCSESCGLLSDAPPQVPFDSDMNAFRYVQRAFINDCLSVEADLTQWYAPATETVSVDIKPGDDGNQFNNNGHGILPIAILTTDTFDASTIVPLSVRLDNVCPRVRGSSGNVSSLEDVDGDGDLDLLMRIEDIAGTYPSGCSDASLTGWTVDGVSIEGQDIICVVP